MSVEGCRGRWCNENFIIITACNYGIEKFYSLFNFRFIIQKYSELMSIKLDRDYLPWIVFDSDREHLLCHKEMFTGVDSSQSESGPFPY